ncbi:peptidylprolyl isomerase [Pedobacter sp. Leaf216]|jgi:FKBP-type peptidyl-prolyl cis-trans isomerase SlyD|uniref:Peptidyl-prolyl cis-trans isomerase n=1 Tax=Pedobacter alluvionis TaxID=475253 RepID=A0A497YD08_9SPHI|nr:MULTISPECIES: FKBP-type peptidyl-prolyl cis-trans isomerase [Pedobacter]KQM77094.1 peptidylprolyl isomerase [Pedobacter sp. Leaf216]MBE5318511.1 FKBP-type peptidyl-prolyl cis-trans isomerase [Pedobacter sp. MR2016-19]MDQ0638568.1 FKBP-type peptidyl-prolyl cis-trans isomerase SlyD [Pedobacter sp. W3I1]QXU39805.1 FKBP-type peptidyl-prolyl cis-trans isomerase [Pedobacter sp. D749]RLJ80356.1 FKBP-type peptidyl prolyl cis-trans isomerase /apo-metallochaperone SlyD [Pedobacter alluvionis]
MNISPNSVVALTYELHTTNEEGQQVFVEKADEENPLVFLYGVGMMLPKFEEHLTGLKTGDEYGFELSAADGYGDIDPGAFADLPKTMFTEAGGELPNVGDVIPLQDNNGNQFRAGVTAVHDETISVDLNHPMAGKNLVFSGVILNVREATQDELAHGHAHGADGHSGH